MKNILLIFTIVVSLMHPAVAQKKKLSKHFTPRIANAEKITKKTNAFGSARQSDPVSHNNGITVGAEGCNCDVPLDGSFSIVPFNGDDGYCTGCPGTPPEYRNDDSFTKFPIHLPFNFCFYGQTVNWVYINTNGNISFDAPYSDFTSVPFPDATYSMIAPFWGDVDTSDPASGLVYYKVTSHALIIKWDSVGYFDAWSDLLNTFQLIITDGTDPLIPNGNNVSFCYKDMQWTTGDASNGEFGFGGDPATVGVNQGNGIDYIQLGTFDSPGTAYNGPYGNPSGVDWLDNQVFTFNVCVSTTNIPPLPSGIATCDTIRLCSGDTLNIPVNFFSPEIGQTTNVTVSTSPGLLGWTVNTDTAGNPAFVNARLIAKSTNHGINTITFTALDDGTPVDTTVINVVILIDSTCLFGKPQANFLSSDKNICSNDCINFTNLSINTTSWHWIFQGGLPSESFVENPQSVCYLSAGTYNVTLIATGSGINDTLTNSSYIAVYPAPPTPVITEQHDTLYCSTDPSYTAYQWYSDSTLVSGATGAFLVITNGGNYNVQVTDENGCKVAVGINIVLGIQNSVESEFVSLFPNPVLSELRIQNREFRIDEIDIYNVLGMKIYSYRPETVIPKPETVIDVSALSPGIYFMQVANHNSSGPSIMVEKFIKE
jgi:PKD repeat protein